MRTGKRLIFRATAFKTKHTDNDYSINFNVVSKGLGSERMSYYLNEAAGEMRDLLVPTLEPPKAKL
jgi:hypothetical protein